MCMSVSRDENDVMCVDGQAEVRGGEWFTDQHRGDGWGRVGVSYIQYGGNYSDVGAFTADKEQHWVGVSSFSPLTTAL